MAKIDTKLIEGYDAMTPEQKIVALTGYDMPDPDYTGYVKKEVFDKAAAESAEWKRKHNALLSEEDKKKQADAEVLQKMEQELTDLRREKTISEYTAQFVAAGYGKDLADATAKAMADGDMAKVFANQQKFITEHDKAYKAELLKDTPKPQGGGGSDDQSNGARFAQEFNALYGAPAEKE